MKRIAFALAAVFALAAWSGDVYPDAGTQLTSVSGNMTIEWTGDGWINADTRADVHACSNSQNMWGDWTHSCGYWYPPPCPAYIGEDPHSRFGLISSHSPPDEAFCTEDDAAPVAFSFMGIGAPPTLAFSVTGVPVHLSSDWYACYDGIWVGGHYCGGVPNQIPAWWRMGNDPTAQQSLRGGFALDGDLLGVPLATMKRRVWCIGKIMNGEFVGWRILHTKPLPKGK